MILPLALGALIDQRYRIVEWLEPSEFGWVYRVSDQQRADQPCRLEEWLPSLQTPLSLTQLLEEWERQLAPLQQFRHAQLPQHQRVFVDRQRLFWVHDWIPGQTYRTLLYHRSQEGQCFTEAEVLDLLLQVLPLLAQLHDRGLYHHHLTLDALVQVDSDPDSPTARVVLTRFGCWRQAAQTWKFTVLRPNSPGHHSVSSGVAGDLQDLAMVALALLHDPVAPAALTDLPNQFVPSSPLSPELAQILQRMLSERPRHQFGSARQADQALSAYADQQGDFASTGYPLPQNRDRGRDAGCRGLPNSLSLSFLGLVLLAMWRLVALLPPHVPDLPRRTTARVSSSPSAQPSASLPAVTESHWQPQAAALGIPGNLLDQLVEETMGAVSTPSSATQTMQRLYQGLATLSPEARAAMGTYYRRDYDRWLAPLADLRLSSASVEGLADAYFANHFPDQSSRPLNPRTTGQIWYAIARDQIRALRQKTNLVTLTAQTGHRDQVLNNGQGEIYQIRLDPGQTLHVQLDVPTSGLRLSAIQNGRPLLQHGPGLNWSAPATQQAATYEVVLIPTRRDRIAYRLSLKVTKG